MITLKKQHQTNKALTLMDCFNQAKSTKTLYTKIKNNKNFKIKISSCKIVISNLNKKQKNKVDSHFS